MGREPIPVETLDGSPQPVTLALGVPLLHSTHALLLPMIAFLPVSLLAVIQSFLLLAEAQQKLSLDTTVGFNSNNLPNPPTFTVPSTTGPLIVSVALCAASDHPPRFFVTNDTTLSQPSPSDVDNLNTYEILVGSEGFGSRALVFNDGGTISVAKDSTATPFEMVVSANSEHRSSCIPSISFSFLSRCNLPGLLPSSRRHNIKSSHPLFSTLRSPDHSTTYLPQLHLPLCQLVLAITAFLPSQPYPRPCPNFLITVQGSPKDNMCY